MSPSKIHESRAAYHGRRMQEELLAKGYIKMSLKQFLNGIRKKKEEPKLAPLPELHGMLKKHGGHPDHDFNSTYMLKLHNRANWAGTHGVIMLFTHYYLKELRKRGIPMYAHTAYRSPTLQAELRAKGVSNLSDGPHQRGCAVDIVHAHYHWSEDEDFWFYVGEIGEQIIRQKGYNMEWGGRWKRPWDPAHWQLKNWRTFPRVTIEEVEKRTPHTLGPKYVG
jgi:hypothetical protein